MEGGTNLTLETQMPVAPNLVTKEIMWKMSSSKTAGTTWGRELPEKWSSEFHHSNFNRSGGDQNCIVKVCSMGQILGAFEMPQKLREWLGKLVSGSNVENTDPRLTTPTPTPIFPENFSGTKLGNFAQIAKNCQIFAMSFSSGEGTTLPPLKFYTKIWWPHFDKNWLQTSRKLLCWPCRLVSFHRCVLSY